jgi:hypothetical protein
MGEGQGILTFSINTSPEMTMPDDKNNGQTVDFAVMQRQLNDLELKVNKQTGEIQTLSAERDHYKTENENQQKAFRELKDKADKQEINALLDSKEYLGKFKADERDTIIEMALSLKDDVVTFASGKSRFEAYMESIKNRPVLVSFSVIAGGVPNQIPAADGQPQSPNDAIVQFAAENKLSTLKVEELEKAESGARQRWPELFNLQGVK